VTQVWYPAVPGSPPLSENAHPDSGQGPFPLVVFAPGFDLYPTAYRTLLQAWARAGYVVAGVTFPLTNTGTPGGTDEADIVNEPRDLEFLISQLLKRDSRRRSFLQGMIDPRRVGLAGHSDGGNAVLASAFDSCCLDRRVRAAIVMSGAELHLAGGAYFPKDGAPLLAIQGSEDAINAPSLTREFFTAARPPKYLLWLQGAGHLAPYTASDAYEAIVRRVTIEFLNRHLKGVSDASVRLPPTELAALRKVTGRGGVTPR
jgi:dienelactone hydrolase